MKKGLIVGALILTMVLGTFGVYANAAETQKPLEFGRQANRFLQDRGVEQKERCNFTQEEREEFLKEKENFFKEKDNLSPEEREAWFMERIEYKREAIKEALKDGKITEERAEALEKHLQERENYHKENGFSNEACQGPGLGIELKDGQGQGQRQGQRQGGKQGQGMGRRNRL